MSQCPGSKGSKLNTVVKVRPHHCLVQGHDHFSSPAGHTIADTGQDAVVLLSHLDTLLGHLQLIFKMADS